MKKTIILAILTILITTISCNNHKNDVNASIMKNENGNMGICFSNNLNEDLIVDYELSFLLDNKDVTSSRTVLNNSLILKAKEHKDIEIDAIFDSVYNSDIRIWVSKGNIVNEMLDNNEDVENNIFNKFSFKVLSDQNNKIAYYVKNKTDQRILVNLAEVTDVINIDDNDLEVIQPINDSIFLDAFEERVFLTPFDYEEENFSKITLGYKFVD